MAEEANNNNNSDFSSMMVGALSSSTSSHGHPVVRGTIASCLRIRTVADVLPPILKPVVANGKLSILFFMAGQMILFILWLPFWMCSFVASEAGVYLGCMVTIVLVGRGVLRMIAFPGSSHRVVSEIEKEFTKYSVRVLTSSANSIVELSEAILAPATSTHYLYNVKALWKRANSYRHRVMAVYEVVLRATLQEHNGSGQQSPPQQGPLDQHGNNVLLGDVGNLSGLTTEAIADGKILLNHLETVLAGVNSLEDQARGILEGPESSPSEAARQAAASLVNSATELRNFVESLKPPSSSTTTTLEGETNEMLEMRRSSQEQQQQTMMDTIRTGFSAILPMLDPPPHTSIFGFDVLRGCVLSRYKGARQLWIPRKGGGRIDCLHVPSPKSSSNHSKAVLYCNPNAGLCEVATGLSVAGGNTENYSNDNCWTDFYTNEGFDIYLFNYAGFGRSSGRSAFFGLCGKAREGSASHTPGTLGRIKRIIYGLVFDFRPTPSSLRADGLAVANHILSLGGVESLVIHGESIGGVAASGTARALTESNQRSKVSLLLCDRTFCNLEAVAQRLVGGWSGYAIRMLAPLWSTDVLGDFLAASCSKVVATDAADAIIADTSSLKAGISFWKEFKSASPTKGIGWKMDAPLHYKMADWENASVTGSRYVPTSRIKPPVWPSDKHVSLDEAFHFAACAKRIGKLASMEKKRASVLTGEDSDEADSCSAPIYAAWKHLGCCEGLCGSPLGVTVKDGFDTTVSWLSSVCVFGGQTVLEGIEHRKSTTQLHEIASPVASDFDCRPPNYEQQESDVVVHPKPIPEVLEALKKIVQENPNDAVLNNASHEIAFVIGTLEYVMLRLSAPTTIETSWKNRHLNANGILSEGSFLNLHCGHNNPYSAEERKRLRALLLQATTRTPIPEVV
mmetsp:Transcript_18209/g.45240  ORF Transcript_18209/g.45240 Transcript_18209/m.45240 type:complete len:908 (-) Transcript_18209:113-2836(-)